MFILAYDPVISTDYIFESSDLKEVENHYIKEISNGIKSDLPYIYRRTTVKITDEHLLKLILRSKLVHRNIISVNDGKIEDLTSNYSKKLLFKNMPYRGVSIKFKNDSIIPYGNWHECFIDEKFIEMVKNIFEERNPDLGGVKEVLISDVKGSMNIALAFPEKEILDRIIDSIKNSATYKEINGRG